MLREPRVTAADVAKALGVSRSTVSRAFSPDAYVKPATREKILKTAKTLGYEPNAIAQALISRRSNIVGIIMGDLHNPFHATIHSALTERLQAAGLIPLTAHLGPEKSIDDAVATFRQYQVGTVLLTSIVVSPDMVAACQESGLRVALLNRIDESGHAASVCADLEQGGALAAKHLVATGCRRIAIVEGLAGSWTTKARLAGHLRGLADAGLTPMAQLAGDYSYQAGVEAASRLLSLYDPPDGVLCGNDLTAIGFLEESRTRFGIAAPRQISVIGFDDIPMAAWRSFDLTTVRLPVRQMVDRVIDLLTRMVASPEEILETTLVPCRLVERGTTTGVAPHTG